MICLLSIPMCKYLLLQLVIIMSDIAVDADVLGKENRRFFHKHDILKLTGLA